MDPVLSFDSVSFSYHSVRGETPAIDNLSFSVNQGEFTVLVGPSGCGKGMSGKRKSMT
ncbi:MAG: ATP-binding cassette domain-containing protein [Lachnospiraceae bacterium]